MTRITVATEIENDDGTTRRLSESGQEVQDGDQVVARIRLGTDETGEPCVQVEMLVSRAPGEEPAERRSDA